MQTHYEWSSPDVSSSADITFVLTSCGRFDLLADTLASFLAFNTAPIARFLLIEDSGDAGVHGVVERCGVRFDVLLNESRCGQMKSLDLAYAGVETPYIFHCEDDWTFFRGGFIEESLLLLENIPAVSTVKCRRRGQNAIHDFVTGSAPISRLAGVEFRQPALDVHPAWGGYSFNPGLRRRADYRRLGSFAECGHEIDVSRWFKQHGMGIASLERPACETTGVERHVHDEFAPASWNELIGSRPPLTASPPESRIAPCPCGSGKRYKHCHGRGR